MAAKLTHFTAASGPGPTLNIRADLERFNETMGRIVLAAEEAEVAARRKAFGDGWCRGFLVGSCAGMLWAVIVLVFA